MVCHGRSITELVHSQRIDMHRLQVSTACNQSSRERSTAVRPGGKPGTNSHVVQHHSMHALRTERSLKGEKLSVHMIWTIPIHVLMP